MTVATKRRVLVLGSRNFNSYTRIERALCRAAASRDGLWDGITVLTLAVRETRTRCGADLTARSIADDVHAWSHEKVQSVREARADVALAFLNREDPKDDMARRAAVEAEKAGLDVWRFYA